MFYTIRVPYNEVHNCDSVVIRDYTGTRTHTHAYTHTRYTVDCIKLHHTLQHIT